MQYWDTNNDGELSFEEAASVTNIAGKFNNLTFSSFDEFRYFLGVSTISNSFRYFTCESLTLPPNLTSINANQKPTDSGFSSNPFYGNQIKKLIIYDGSDALDFGYAKSIFNSLETLYLGRNIIYSSYGPSYSTTYCSPFENTTSLTEITIGNNVTSLENRMFSGCSFTSITIPNNIISIGSNSLPGSLTEITFSEGDENLSMAPLYGPISTVHLGRTISNSIYSTSSVFYYLSSLSTVYIYNTDLGNNIFKNCPITTVEFVGTVANIGANAFSGCTGLTEISLPEGLQSIGSNAFMDCSHLSSITVPSTVNSIGDNPMPSNKYIHFRSTVPVPAFQISLPCVLVVPDNAVADYKTAWPDYSMYIVGEGDLTEKVYNITAQESSSALLEAIGENNTFSVVKLKISGTINSYDMMVMRNKMPNLRELDLSEVSIVANNYDYGTGVSQNNVFPDFLKTTVLTSLVLPNTITSIGNSAFNSTTLQLGTLTIPASVQSIGNSAFYKSTLETLTIPASVQSIGDCAFQKSTIDVRFVENSQLNSIGGYAFSESSLVSLKLDNVTIAAKAFSSSSLKTIEVNGGSIGNSAFAGCNNLETIVVNSSLPACTRGSDGPFSDCGSLKNVTLGTDYIQRYTFYHCSLRLILQHLSKSHRKPYYNTWCHSRICFC